MKDSIEQLQKQFKVICSANGAAEMQNTVLMWFLDHQDFYQANYSLIDDLLVTMEAKHAIMESK
jgi:hypothetical protein